MSGKLMFVIGFGAGYVLGAKAGRERYEQITGSAQKVWKDPRVQEKVAQGEQVAKEKAGDLGTMAAVKASEVGDAAAEKAHEVGDAAAQKASEVAADAKHAVRNDDATP
ncbi:YtxH domain-containing protein [Nocardioides sambongensis]|uniref:YtxH domain-containing protein n=1 Tax=Nocardioides sambongensis TaxID=2589074 RepID=UPI00112DE462|nr:YtxH domain-containing protein [Nocardioides sambongensis]